MKKHSKLESIYLMNVSLYLSNYREIYKFIQINKKCFEIINNLKINPYFQPDLSLELFLKHFSPNTINRRNLLSRITEKDKQCKLIRNPDYVIEDNEDEIKSLIPKIQNIRLVCFQDKDYFDDLLIENAI